jgi:hypothetical protein
LSAFSNLLTIAIGFPALIRTAEPYIVHALKAIHKKCPNIDLLEMVMITTINFAVSEKKEQIFQDAK